MNSVDDKPRATDLRPEFTGPEELDRVLIHLREARERVAHKSAGGRRGKRKQPHVEEKLAFEAAEPPAPTQPAPGHPSERQPPQAHASEARVATTTSSDTPLETGHAPTRPEGNSAPAAPTSHTANPTGKPTSAEAMARATQRLKRAAATLTAATTAAPPITPPPADKREAATPHPTISVVKGELRRAVLASKPAFKALAGFSFATNILMLAGPLFMLQVYDRVMTSHSMPTLLALSILTAAIYGVIGLLELVRSRVIVRIGVELDRRTSERVFAAALRRSLAEPGSSMHALRELDQVRQFVAGPGPLTFFDAPWTPVYLLVIFLTHWTLGVAASIGALILLAIAWASEVRSRRPLSEAGRASHKSLELAENGQRNAEAITAMGMLNAYRDRWQSANRDALAWQVLAADRLSSLASLSKSLRLLLQSLMLAIGAALAVNGYISAGSIIAATIIFGRALAPVEQIVAQWRSFVKARESFGKLEALLDAHPEPERRVSLPAPKGHVEARDLRVTSPDGRTVILSGLSFAVDPGQMLAIIGPSASGKSTLVRTLVGLWSSSGGEVLLDGARLDRWNADELGRHIGYLPQSVELFAGTVRDNISRFEPDASDDDVVEAARAAHAHDMIVALPKGYDTELGAFGVYLSAGQRQRIGLARALFGNPALIVLDEPNANLDRTGDEALSAAIDGMRARGRAIVLVSHRVQAIGKADRLLYLERGAQRAFGSRDDVLHYLQHGGPAPSGRDAGEEQATASRTAS
ncbi:MAG: type I secretion system permease/ATPase [Hyphomicrobiaceae bacterium]